MLAAYIAAVLAPFSGLTVSVIATQAITGEAGVIADSILSKSVTRTEYMSAKIVSRMGVTLGIYVAVIVPFSYLIIRYGTSDTSLGGVTMGLLMVAMLLMFLAAFGIILSTLIRNVLVAVLVLLVGIVASGAALQFLDLRWMSATAVIYELPQTFRGETPIWDQIRVLTVFPALTAAAIFGSLWVFRRNDL